MNLFLPLVILILTFNDIIYRTAANEGDSPILDDPLVHISNGDVRGSVLQSTKGRPFYSFVGIRYARPPIGPLRFKPPVAPDDWTGVLEAVTYCSPCPQSPSPNNFIINEDCLCINVFTPSIKKINNKRLAVMVYIHGGSFIKGSSALYRPERLMDRDVCLVTMNYRLGALGYLSTADEASPGNYAILDHRMALRWVKTNIEAFGGDPDRVTLFGVSAGSMHVLHQLLLPDSQGLIHAAIAESGTPIGALALEKDPRPWANKLAEFFSCPTANSGDLMNCLRDKSVRDILNGSIVIAKGSTFNAPFRPVIDGVYIRKDPNQLFLKGDFLRVPTIFGTNKDEGVTIYTLASPAGYFSTFDQDFFTVKLPRLIFLLTKEANNLDEMAKAVKYEYYDRIDLNNRTACIEASINFASDAFMKAPVTKNTILMALHNRQTYMYSFEYAGTPSVSNFTGQRLVNHADEMYYQFNITTTITEKALIEFNDRDQLMSDQIIDTWTQFAQTLGTSKMWRRTLPRVILDYLQINADGFKMATGFNTKRMLFWNVLIPTIGQLNPVLINSNN